MTAPTSVALAASRVVAPLVVAALLVAPAAALPLAAAAPSSDGDLRLVEAAERRDWEAVRALIAEGTSPDVAHSDGATALHWAVHWNDLPTVGVLLDAGAAIDARNDLGVPPLWIALDNGSAEIALLSPPAPGPPACRCEAS